MCVKLVSNPPDNQEEEIEAAFLVAVLMRHPVDYDVSRERRRFRLEWELAIFPIF